MSAPAELRQNDPRYRCAARRAPSRKVLRYPAPRTCESKSSSGRSPSPEPRAPAIGSVCANVVTELHVGDVGDCVLNVFFEADLCPDMKQVEADARSCDLSEFNRIGDGVDKRDVRAEQTGRLHGNTDSGRGGLLNRWRNRFGEDTQRVIPPRLRPRSADQVDRRRSEFRCRVDDLIEPFARLAP